MVDSFLENAFFNREERSKNFPGSFQELDFEHTVLESALESVVGRLRRHLQIIKPALEMLLQEVEHNPETGQSFSISICIDKILRQEVLRGCLL